jgi:hypothetical protein
MGNVLSVHAEIFLKGTDERIDKPIKIISEILKFQLDQAYNGYPIFIKEYWKNKSIQISYTSKYEPTSLIRFSEKYENSIDKIFARTYDETGDWDHIIELPKGNFKFDEEKRKCKYSFDEIRHKTKELRDYNSIKIEGQMNSCCNLINQENRDIINLPIEYLDNLKTYSELEIESKRIEEINSIIKESTDILFLNNELTIHRKIGIEEYNRLKYKKNNSEFMGVKYNNGKYDIYSSGWLNCADENYLKYIKTKKSDT